MTNELPRSAQKPRNLVGLFLTWQFVWFLVVGLSAAIIHWTARYLLTPVIGYEFALVAAYAIGIAVAYILNAKFVFADALNERRQQVVYFVGFNLLMAPFVVGIAYGLSEHLFPQIGWTYNPRGIAHAIGVASPIFVNFLLHKFFTFKGA